MQVWSPLLPFVPSLLPQCLECTRWTWTTGSQKCRPVQKHVRSDTSPWTVPAIVFVIFPHTGAVHPFPYLIKAIWVVCEAFAQYGGVLKLNMRRAGCPQIAVITHSLVKLSDHPFLTCGSTIFILLVSSVRDDRDWLSCVLQKQKNLLFSLCSPPVYVADVVDYKFSTYIGKFS